VNRFLMNLLFCGPIFAKRFTIVVLFMNRFLHSPFAKEIAIVCEPIVKWVVALRMKAKCQTNYQQGCSRFQELLPDNLSHQNSGPTKHTCDLPFFEWLFSGVVAFVLACCSQAGVCMAWTNHDQSNTFNTCSLAERDESVTCSLLAGMLHLKSHSSLPSMKP